LAGTARTFAGDENVNREKIQRVRAISNTSITGLVTIGRVLLGVSGYEPPPELSPEDIRERASVREGMCRTLRRIGCGDAEVERLMPRRPRVVTPVERPVGFAPLLVDAVSVAVAVAYLLSVVAKDAILTPKLASVTDEPAPALTAGTPQYASTLAEGVVWSGVGNPAYVSTGVVGPLGEAYYARQEAIAERAYARRRAARFSRPLTRARVRTPRRARTAVRVTRTTASRGSDPPPPEPPGRRASDVGGES
jgi:hypothetical protein